MEEETEVGTQVPVRRQGPVSKPTMLEMSRAVKRRVWSALLAVSKAAKGKVRVVVALVSSMFPTA